MFAFGKAVAKAKRTAYSAPLAPIRIAAYIPVDTYNANEQSPLAIPHTKYIKRNSFEPIAFSSGIPKNRSPIIFDRRCERLPWMNIYVTGCHSILYFMMSAGHKPRYSWMCGKKEVTANIMQLMIMRMMLAEKNEYSNGFRSGFFVILTLRRQAKLATAAHR